MRSVRSVYQLIGAVLAAFVAVLAAIVIFTPAAGQFGHAPQILIQPVVALAGLTAFVWCLMVAWRNGDRQIRRRAIALAWVFVLTRGIHAIIHIGFNHVPLRFAAFFAGSITLGVLWIRFAAQNL
jgi:hypothetical protein